MQGDELAGFIVATRIAEQREPSIVEDQQLGRGIWTRSSLEPDLVAMSRFVDDKRSERDAWELVEEGTPRFAAWRDRLRLWLGGEIKAERVWLEPFDPNVHGLSATHPNFKLRKSKNGFRVPARPGRRAAMGRGRQQRRMRHDALQDWGPRWLCRSRVRRGSA
jgi:hypothetical protein